MSGSRSDAAPLLCAAARTAFAAAAVSLCVVDREADELVYVAADGVGATEIVGTRLSAGAGLAGFVAASGQSLVLARVADDPRFALAVAERTGYVPTSMLVVPVFDDTDVAGVLSVLDRSAADAGGAHEALALGTAFADLASTLLDAFRLGDRDDDGEGDSVSIDERIDLFPPDRRQATRSALHAIIDLFER